MYRLRVVLILTHNLSASVIEVAHQGRLSLEEDSLSALLSSKERANRHRNELRGCNPPQTFRLWSLCLETKRGETVRDTLRTH